MKEKVPFILINTLLLLIPLLALTDGWTELQTERGTNTLAASRLKELFFQLCCCVGFLVVAGNSFRCYLPTIWYQLCHCVFFLFAVGHSYRVEHISFWFCWEIVLDVTFLSTIPVVPLCQFFGCGRKQFLVAQVVQKIIIWFL